MRTTIIADASFCPDTKVGGYGFWIANERGRKGGDGIFKEEVENNIAAEMMALLNALSHAIKIGLIQDGEGVLIQTDCTPAIAAFMDERKTVTQQEDGLIKWYKSFIHDHKLSIEFRHVKGHSGKKENRYVANNICDRRARENMRRARGQLHLRKLRESFNEQPER